LGNGDCARNAESGSGRLIQNRGNAPAAERLGECMTSYTLGEFQPMIVKEGKCKCGRWLIIEKIEGVKGFVTKHEIPMCAAYQAQLTPVVKKTARLELLRKGGK
jgi:hypothetical protein